MNATKLTDGIWTARQAPWEILLEGRDGRWNATVSTLPDHRQHDREVVYVGSGGFTSPRDAAKWATNRLKDHGISVFLLSSDGGPPKTLIDYLDFTPVIP